MGDLDKSHLAFHFDIENVQFNHKGRYFLKMTVLSSYVTLTKKEELYQKLRVRKGDESNGVVDYGNEAVTDVLEQEELKKYYQFQDSRFTFYLPRGFCKNDKHHDVHLVVEAFEVQLPHNEEGKRVGEAKFAIYPRTNAPKVKLKASFGEDLYKTTNNLTLLRTSSTDNLTMHCGRVKYTVRFRRISELPKKEGSSPVPSPIEPTPRQPTPRDPTPREPTPQEASPPPDPPKSITPTPVPPQKQTTPTEQEQLSPSPTFERPPNGRSVIESPLERYDNRSRLVFPGSSHVARPADEEILVIYHGATNLPSPSDGSPPIPYGSLSVLSRDELQQKAPTTTRATRSPTRSPTWEEAMAIDIPAHKAKRESLVLKVCDAVTKQILVKYAIPVSYFTPFHHYHLELVQPTENKGEVRLFCTILRRTAALPVDHSSPNYFALEVLLRGVREELQNPLGSIVVVGRMVKDYFSYKREMLSTYGGDRAAGISVTTVSFPNPHPSSFAVPSEKFDGHTQVTLPGKPTEQPRWNHPFLFCNNRDKATLFTPGAALVFEFYQATAAMNDSSWRLHSPIGFSVVLLEQNVYKHLVAPGGRMGVRVDGLPIQGSVLKTTANRTPTIGVVLKLIVSEHPSALSNVSDLELLPLIGEPEEKSPYGKHHEQSPPSRGFSPEPQLTLLHRKVKRDILPIEDGDLPPTNAMEYILPEYQYIFVDPQQQKLPRRYPTYPNSLSQDLGPQSSHLLDYQMRELEKYRTAVQKMGQDILTLRQQIQDRDAQNSQLRRGLSHYNDTTKLLMDSQELDGLTKPELAARYVSIKQKLSTQTSELKTYRGRVQALQNELIQKNDKDKHYSEVSRAHRTQNELLQKLQQRADKVRRLEDAIKKQEKVINKLEKTVVRGDGVPDDNANTALINENRRLRDIITDLREQERDREKINEEEEKLELYEKLDKAEGRIRSLERQMTENARTWSKDRSELLVRLQETEHGFRGSPLGYSKLDTIKSYDEPRRFSKAPKKSLQRNSMYY